MSHPAPPLIEAGFGGTAASVPPVGSTTGGLVADIRAARIIWARELIRFRQDKVRILSATIQPVLFLFVLGNGLGTLTNRSTAGVDLKTFMFPGVLATSTLFTAMFSAISIVWDREFGFLREMLVAPVRRASIMWGKAFGGATVATLQGLLVLALAPLVGIPLNAFLVLALLGEVFLISFALTAFGLAIAARIQQMQTVMSIMQMLLLPLSFLSGALYPTNNLPVWLDALVRINPLTYAVHAVRATVFEFVDAPPAALAKLNPAMTWWGWEVPIWAQLCVVAGLGAVLLAVAIRQFETAE